MSSGAKVTGSGCGLVVIGRNEGERLRRCLQSLGPSVRDAVYVDSGSKDGSQSLARELGAQMIELDLAKPFTAARARNEGFFALEAARGPVEFVQFLDGDCELEPGWLERGMQELRADPRLAVVFGRRRERHAAASIYNRLCDLEWDVPLGDCLSCGGDALMRAAVLRDCGGFNPDLIAGEEPELCLRMRERGFRIRRIDAAMSVHDAAMHRFGQWWRRAQRSGYVEAEGLATLGLRYPRRRSAVSSLLWGLLLPAAAVTGIAWALATGRPAWGAAVAGVTVLLYGVLWLRIWLRTRQRWGGRSAALYSTFCALAKWPALHGMSTYVWRRLTRRPRRLIEYKD